MTTSAKGGTDTTAAGTVSDTTRKNTSETTAAGASLGIKFNTASTSTSSADTAGGTTP